MAAAVADQAVFKVRRDFRTPPPGHIFVYAHDPSLGVESGDPSAGSLWCATLPKWPMVATYHGRLSTREQEVFIWRLSRLYNNAYIAIEENKGHDLISGLERRGANLVTRGMIEGFQMPGSKRIGWCASDKTKQRGVNRLKNAMEYREIEFCDPLFARQVGTFIMATGRRGQAVVRPSARIRDDAADTCVIAVDVMTGLNFRVPDERDRHRDAVPDNLTVGQHHPDPMQLLARRREAKSPYDWSGDRSDWESPEINY